MSAAARIKRAARRGVRFAALAADRGIATAGGITILGYHQVGGPQRTAVNLSPALFEEQLAWLSDNAEVITLDDAVTRLAHTPAGEPTAPAPRPLVVITFDDGTADFAKRAVPLLDLYQLPATLYLATSFVEEGRSFWDDGTVLSWGALAEAVATGLVDVGSHTHTHALLDRIPAASIDAELERSISLIADRLGVEARHFAYPKALGDGLQADVAVRRLFHSAAVAGGGTNRFGRANLWRLARQPIVVADGMQWFTRKASGGMRLEGALRDRLDRRRYAGASR